MANETLEEQIKSAAPEALAANVVAYRLIGLNKSLALACMNELVSRREAGDEFDYENYIEEKMKVDLPAPVFKDIPSLFNPYRK
jgi:hypothetical protein